MDSGKREVGKRSRAALSAKGISLLPDPDDEHGGMVVKRVYLQDGNLVLLSGNPQARPRLQVIPLKKRPLQRFLVGRVVHVARDEE